MKNIVKSLVILSAVGLLIIGVTKASWSDTAQSTNNVFTAGTLDLKLSDNDESVADSVAMTWTGTGMVPGGAPVDATLKVRNSGTIAGSHVHFSLAHVVTDTLPTANPDMASYLRISALEYNGSSILSQIPDANTNGYVDLADFAAAGSIGANTSAAGNALTDIGVDHAFRMAVGLDATAPSEIQGDSVATTLTATLHQADGQ